MTAAKRRTTSLLVLGILATLTIPGLAQAAPAAPTVIVFGNKKPTAGDPNCLNVECGRIFANSFPYAPDGVPGSLYYKGTADPNVYIDVVVDDEAVDTDGIYYADTVATAPPTADPNVDGYGPGAFGVGVPSGFQKHDELNAIFVTDLGTHTANATAGPTSTNPADWGPTTLYAKFTARNPTNASDVSATTVQTITKYAGTPFDAAKPGFNRVGFPPEHWCHFVGKGANDPFIGASFGGTAEGSCSDFAFAPFGAVPDLTWLFCTEILSDPHYFVTNTLGVANPFPRNPFRGNYCDSVPQKHTPRGEAYVIGTAVDDTAAAYGVASEIAEVTLDITQGSTSLASLTNEEIIAAGGMVTRYAGRLAWSLPQQILSFEPNWPNGELYKWTITVKDAWGNTSTTASPDVTVYPY